MMTRRHINRPFEEFAFKLIIFFFLILSTSALSQDAPQRVYMYLNYFQDDEGQYLISELKYRVDRNFVQLENGLVQFYLDMDTMQVRLGSGTTSADGKVTLDLGELKISKDSSGYAHYKAEFEGTDEFRSARSSISIKEINLTLDPQIVDSIPTIVVNGEELVQGHAHPIEDSDIEILVKRLYSNMPLASGSLEEGTFSFELSDDIPGDAFGDLAIIAMINEHDDYGTVQTKQKIRWGVPVSYELEKKPRALWSRAPLWIIISVWVAFLAVWFHYFLAISKLFGMKKL